MYDEIFVYLVVVNNVTIVVYSFTTAIADLAEKNHHLLVPDEGAEYDQLLEINLDEVRRLIQ